MIQILYYHISPPLIFTYLGGLRTGRNVPSKLMFRTFYRLFISTSPVDTGEVEVDMKSCEGSVPENSKKNFASGVGPMDIEQQTGKQSLLIEKSYKIVLLNLYFRLFTLILVFLILVFTLIQYFEYTVELYIQKYRNIKYNSILNNCRIKLFG